MPEEKPDAMLQSDMTMTQARHTDSPIFGGIVLDKSPKLGPVAFYKVEYTERETEERKAGYVAVFMLSGTMLASIDNKVTEWMVPVAPVWELAVDPKTGQAFIETDEE